MKTKRKHWYKFYLYECPICGSSKTYKERIYEDIQPRPQDRSDRYVFTWSYDYCDAFY